MRIAGHIEHPVLKITIFQMDNRFTVKFEDGTLEQAYKFRKSDTINNAADIQKLVDEKFTQDVLQQMKALRNIHQDALARFHPESDDDDEFDDII